MSKASISTWSAAHISPRGPKSANKKILLKYPSIHSKTVPRKSISRKIMRLTSTAQRKKNNPHHTGLVIRITQHRVSQ